MDDHKTESKYYCAGRYCQSRDWCHRHTSSVHVNNAEFYDYDLLMMRQKNKICNYFIDRDEATGVMSKKNIT